MFSNYYVALNCLTETTECRGLFTYQLKRTGKREKATHSSVLHINRLVIGVNVSASVY